MIEAILDTHAALWYLGDDPRLSKAAGDKIDAILASSGQVGVSSVSLVEIVYLLERGRIEPGSLDLILRAFDEGRRMIEVPVDRSIIGDLAAIPRAQVPDMPDRIIAATAANLGVPLVSRDRKIRASAVPTIW